MKVTELRQIVREEISKTLNEGAILKAIEPAPTGEVKVAVEALEKLLQSTGAKLDYEAIANCVIDIIDAAKQEERDEYSDY
jgi:hypothetical protein